MKHLSFLLLSGGCLLLAGHLNATPSNDITTLLNNIATNTDNTATTTSTTMTTALNNIAREQKHFSQAQSTFVYGSQSSNPTTTYLDQQSNKLKMQIAL